MRLPVVLPLLATLALSCSGNSGGSSSEPVAIGAAELEAMLASITKASFGEEYLSMDWSKDNSGPETIEDIIEDADDPEDERADARSFGLISGHSTTYFQTEAISDRQGPIVAGAGVLLFEDNEGASGYLEDNLNDGRRDTSGTTEVGSLQGFEVFDEAHNFAPPPVDVTDASVCSQDAHEVSGCFAACASVNPSGYCQLR